MADFDALAFDELEAIVRAGGSYVRATDDLRPRVLEAARRDRRQRRTRLATRRAMLAVLLVATWAGPANDHAGAEFPQLAAANARLHAPQPSLRADSDEGVGWIYVDAMTEIRQRQSEILPTDL
jgi:hypothetical protein